MQNSKYGVGGTVQPADTGKKRSEGNDCWIGMLSYILGVLTVIVIEGIVR